MIRRCARQTIGGKLILSPIPSINPYTFLDLIATVDFIITF